MPAVKVNASGSRNDIDTAKAIHRSPAHLQGGRPVRPVLDSPPYEPPPSCLFVKKNGSVCGAQLRGSQQLEAATCLGHMRFLKAATDATK